MDFLKQNEVLHQIQQTHRVAYTAQHGFQRHPASLVLTAHFFPFGEVLPSSGDAAHTALAAVGDDNEGVGPEKLRHGILVITQVAGEGGLQTAVGGLQFNEYQRQSVYKAHKVGPPGVHLPGDPELGTEQKVIVARVAPIDHPHHFNSLAVPGGILYGDAHVVLEQLINLAVGGHHAHARAVAGQFLDGLVDGFKRGVRVKPLQGRAQASGKDNLSPGFAAKCAGAVIELVIGVDCLPAQIRHQGDGRLFNQCVFGVVRHLLL